MIVIFGGAFNPPTIAHDEVARHLLALPTVEKLVFVPVGDHYEKPDLIPADHRVKMLEIMVEKLPDTSVSKIEVEAQRALKTIETLERFQVESPEAEFAFVMGADNLSKLRNWYAYERLIHSFKMIIVNRGELDIHAFIEKHFSHLSHQFLIIEDFDKVDISSSQYRADVTKTELLLPQIEKYIKEKGLYQGNFD